MKTVSRSNQRLPGNSDLMNSRPCLCWARNHKRIRALSRLNFSWNQNLWNMLNWQINRSICLHFWIYIISVQHLFIYSSNLFPQIFETKIICMIIRNYCLHFETCLQAKNHFQGSLCCVRMLAIDMGFSFHHQYEFTTWVVQKETIWEIACVGITSQRMSHAMVI